MQKYVVKLARTKFVEITVDAKDKEEAKRKVMEGEYKKEDVLEDEYFLPSTDWEVTTVKLKE